MNRLRSLEHWDRGFRGMDVCVRLFYVCVFLSVGSGRATGWSHVQGVLPTVRRLRYWKRGEGPQGIYPFGSTDTQVAWQSLHGSFRISVGACELKKTLKRCLFLTVSSPRWKYKIHSPLQFLQVSCCLTMTSAGQIKAKHGRPNSDLGCNINSLFLDSNTNSKLGKVKLI
jgi:hypothetical protein